MSGAWQDGERRTVLFSGGEFEMEVEVSSQEEALRLLIELAIASGVASAGSGPFTVDDLFDVDREER